MTPNPVQVSRAVSSLSLVAPYYIDILGGTMVHHQVLSGDWCMVQHGSPGFWRWDQADGGECSHVVRAPPVLGESAHNRSGR